MSHSTALGWMEWFWSYVWTEPVTHFWNFSMFRRMLRAQIISCGPWGMILTTSMLNPGSGIWTNSSNMWIRYSRFYPSMSSFHTHFWQIAKILLKCYIFKNSVKRISATFGLVHSSHVVLDLLTTSMRACQTASRSQKNNIYIMRALWIFNMSSVTIIVKY